MGPKALSARRIAFVSFHESAANLFYPFDACL